MKFYATFGIGGALAGYYAQFLDTGAMLTQYDLEHAVRRYCHNHFPKDWAFLYLDAEFDGQVDRYELVLLGSYNWDGEGFYKL